MASQRDAAMSLMDQGRFSEAAKIFEKRIEASPNDGSLYFFLGQCQRSDGRLSEAIKTLQKAVELTPEKPFYLTSLGAAQHALGDYKSAISSIEMSIRLDPSIIVAYHSLGGLYRELGEHRKSLEWFSRAADQIISAVSDEVKKDHGRCYRDEIVDGKKTRVVLPYLFEKSEEFLRSEPTYSYTKNQIGMCLVSLGDLPAAREQFLEAIEYTPAGYEFPEPINNIKTIDEFLDEMNP